MIYKVNISYITCMFATLFAALLLPATLADVAEALKFMEPLSNFILGELTKKHPQKIICVSPFSIQNEISMAGMGADRLTAVQIYPALTSFPRDKREYVSDIFYNILSDYRNSDIIKISNKIYISKDEVLQREFISLLVEKLYSHEAFIDFANNAAASQTINFWIEKQTNNLIKSLNLFGATTRLALLNAIHFRGSWLHPFEECESSETNAEQRMKVTANFKFTYINNIQASAVLLPYKDCDLSMLVIMPKDRQGMAELNTELKKTSVADITQQMRLSKLTLVMPKFKAELQADLSDILSEFGMKSMFSAVASFGRMFRRNNDFHFPSMVHKTVIEVNAKGTEAAAATSGAIADHAPLPSTSVKVRDPFHYIIINSKNVILFEGVYDGY